MRINLLFFVTSLSERARMNARIVVATGRRTPSGVMDTAMPAALHAATSTLSYLVG
jgi:hypothetical protein